MCAQHYTASQLQYQPKILLQSPFFHNWRTYIHGTKFVERGY